MTNFAFYIEYPNGADKTERHNLQGVAQAVKYAVILSRRALCVTVTAETGATLRVEEGRIFCGSRSIPADKF